MRIRRDFRDHPPFKDEEVFFCLSCVGMALNYSLQHGSFSSLMLTCDMHNPGMRKLAAKVGANPFT